MESIRHLFHINSTAQNVYEAIVNKDHLKNGIQMILRENLD